MRLNKPPLIEAWMSFRFDPGIAQPAWNRHRFKLLLDDLASTHPDIQEMKRQAVELTASKRNGVPKVRKIIEDILAMRALSEDGLRAVQMRSNELVVNYIRGGNDYPGFDALLEEAMEVSHRYQELYRPLGVVEVALHYIDVVFLPKNDEGNVDTEEYLTVDFRIPPNFGNFSAFDIRTVVRPLPEKLPVHMYVASEAGLDDDPEQKIRIEWHTSKVSTSVMGEEEVRANLNAAHDRLAKCFQSIFTAKGWALLEPESL